MKVGIVGLGSIAKKHIIALKQICPDVILFALRHNENTASTEVGIKNVYSYEQLLCLELDFIIIANPTSLHRETINQLSNCNIPLFIEKPLFDNLTEVFPTTKSSTYVACNLRFLDCIKYVKSHLLTERINEVNSYCGSYLPDWRPGIDWRTCYSANKKMGGGVHIDLIHEIDYIYWLFGQPNGVQKVLRNVSSLEISSYDYANYVLEYDKFAASVVLNYYRRDYKRTLEIITDESTWNVNLANNEIRNNEKVVFSSSQTFLDTYVAQMKYFISSLYTDDNKFNEISEAYQILKICLK